MKRLELLVFLSVGVAVVCGLACRDVSQRVDCGYAGISAENCTTRGCCYGQQAGQPSCFFSEDGVTVETVHIIQSNHLDVGYADLSVNIVNEYFTKYFPRAARIGAELRARGGLERLRWMTHTYLVTLFLDCPSGLGLHCPDADAVATFKSAVAAGDITWHAFPYNAQLEVMDVSMVRFGLNLTHTIDDLFGLPHKKTLSQRDVPGMPRAVIPILVDNGVNAISIGCNGAVIPPNIPLGGVWRDDATNTSILTLQHPFGYGQLPNPSQNTPLDGDSLVLPGLSHAMVYAWRGDNAGPPESVEEVLANFAQVRAAFPTAKNVVASTLDNFTSLAQSVRHLLPVISQDQGDSWVLGPPSDPYKVAALRELHRQRAQCVDGTPTEAHCQCSAKEMFDFSRLALKNGEHTWGLSLGHMKDQSNYTNAYLQEQLASGDKASLLMEQSWKEQREWGITVPVSKLGASPFGAHVRAALDALEPRVPSTEGWHRESDPTREIALSKRVQLSFDATSGAVVSLVDSRTGVQWASSERPLARVLYNSLVEADFTRFQNEYLFVHEHFDTEYGKPNVTASNPRRQMLPPRLQSVWTRTAEGKFRTDILVELSYVGVSDVHEHYGAPETVWVEYASDDDDTSISVTLSLFNKTTTRFPEAAFFQFLPTYDAGETPQWEFRRLHGWTGLHDSVVGANRGMPGIDDAGIRLTRSHSNKTLSIASLDAGFVSFDDPSPFPSPLITQPDPFKGAAFTLWANPYNTNYPFWYPFDGRANLKYRFTLAL